ncbi:MAG: AEC family transporter [Gammaproteobacteria bacterium]
MSGASLILPDFAFILLGALLRRLAAFGSEFWRGLERLVYFVLFPALLFVAIARAPFDDGAGRFVAVGVLATLAGAALGYLAKPCLRVEPRTFASAVQCAFRFNSFLALAPAAALGGPAGLALIGMLIGCAVPVCNLLSVWGLARAQDAHLWRELLRNPLILATVSGFLFNIAGGTLPGPLEMFLGRLGQASVPLGLMTVGAGLRLIGVREAPALAAWMVAVKLLLVPACAFSLAHLAGLSTVQTQMVVLFAALPSASSSYILAVRMGGNGELVAFIVSSATILAVITLPAWLLALH